MDYKNGRKWTIKMASFLQSNQITTKCKEHDVLDVMLIFNNRNGDKPFRVDATAKIVLVDGKNSVEFINEPTGDAE